MTIFQGETLMIAIKLLDDNGDVVLGYDDAIVSIDTIGGE